MTTSEPVYDVVWPLAPSAAPSATLATRSADLNGKIVGELWDYLFKGEEIFPLIRKKLAARYPGAIVLVTHDPGAVQALKPDRAILLPDGVEDAWSDDLLELVELA